MPRRSKVSSLPDDVRRDLDARLIDGAFGGYAGLAAWLGERGYAISESSIQRYGADLGKRIERIKLASEHAKALVEASGDTGALADASMRVIQERMWDVLSASEERDVKALAGAARALADTARASVTLREERRRALREAAEEAASSAAAEARRAGATLPDAALQRIREQVYGIYGDDGNAP